MDVLNSAARADAPEIALVLGSGFDALAERLDVEVAVPFAGLAGWPTTSVAGHRGRVLLGSWADRRILVFQGRLHRYEGHDWDTVILPVRLAAELGARVFIATNAAGGIHADLEPGDLALISDHLDATRPLDLRGRVRKSPYSSRLRALVQESARLTGAPLFEGTYAAVTGPNFETPAEIRALAALGADLVGMSTLREIDAAHRLGMECLALSCVTNHAAGTRPGRIRHDQVLTTASARTDQVAALLEGFLASATQAIAPAALVR